MRHQFQFFGNGASFFGILFLNIILTVLTLGLYYPWGKVKSLQYRYQNIEVAGSRFTFHGTGQEMFKGFVKGLAYLIVLFCIYYTSQMSGSHTIALIGSLVFFVGYVILIPIAVHGTFRYRLSRTSVKGIHFRYTGSLRELFTLCIKGILLSVITLGIYAPWFIMDFRRYVLGHCRYGNTKVSYHGRGSDFFVMNLLGIFLTFITFGIYSFWFRRDLHRYLINNMTIEQDGVHHKFDTTISAEDYFFMNFLYIILLYVTLGLALPWVLMNIYRRVLDNLSLEESFNFDAVTQDAEDYADATGEGWFDMLDLGITF